MNDEAPTPPSLDIRDLMGRLEEAYGSINALNTELQLSKMKLEHLSLHDELTGLPNRSLLSDRFEMARAATGQTKRSFAVFLLDLNRFKEINETYGHEIGDQVLQITAQRLMRRLRSGDTLARVGDDEFAFVIKTRDSLLDLLRQAEEAIDIVQRPMDIRGTHVDVGVSIGIALYGDHGFELADLMNCAAQALGEIKRRGGGFRIHDIRNETNGTLGQALMMRDLRHAIDHDRLELYFQPKVDMETARLVGCEALVRLNHSEKGLVMPSELVPLAERDAMIMPFNLKVLSLAFEQSFAWRKDGLELPIAVNLSAQCLHDMRLSSAIFQLLDSWQIPSNFLVVEVTESAFMVDPDGAIKTLTRLAANGVRISIDDFGTGYSSLAYISRMPVQEVKIDRSFVSRMHDHREDRAIVRSVIDLARNLDMSVVAEGIETQRDWTMLRDFGCVLAQGYYLSRPLPAKEFERWKENWRSTGPDARIQDQAGTA